MVKKKFIDKKKAVTYNLVYRSTEDADDEPMRMLVEADKLGKIEEDSDYMDRPISSNSRYPPGHPLAWLEEEQRAEPITDARRQELIELGFDDDGYDYLKHLRVLGKGAASLEGLPPPSASTATTNESSHQDAQQREPTETAATGPSVFVKATAIKAPQEDIALFDASKLTVMGAAEEEEAVEGLMGGVSAFSKKTQTARGAAMKELKEIEAIMKALEHDDAEELDESTTLLDDFIVAATAHDTVEDEAAAAGDLENGDDGEEEYSSVDGLSHSDEFYSSGDEDEDERQGIHGAIRSNKSSTKPPARPGSIASTYWREERSDRRNLLTVVDEQFEHLALEYDEAELDLADLDEDIPDDARGVADHSDFNHVMDEFLEQHGRSATAHESGVAYDAPRVSSAIKHELEAHGMDDNDADVAILKAREALRRAEEEEETSKLFKKSNKDDTELMELRAPRRGEKWDCESVLSLSSNLYNHPGTITEPPSERRKQGVASTGGVIRNQIRLNKFGIPMGVLPPRGGGGATTTTAGAEVEEDNEEDEEEEEGAIVHELIFERRKDETAEEKKARKNAVKAAKRDARVAKKELKTLYKDEANKAHRRVATAQVQPTVII